MSTHFSYGEDQTVCMMTNMHFCVHREYTD